ncbi:hypothetical protein J2X71_007194 [Rhizobium sp. 1399]|nr:hypothetical protein [Rhizobium sp. 1399]
MGPLIAITALPLDAKSYAYDVLQQYTVEGVV